MAYRATFAPAVKVNTGTGEAIDDSPRAGFTRGNPYVVLTDDRALATPALSPLYDIEGARPGSPNRRLDGDAGRPVDALAAFHRDKLGDLLAVAGQVIAAPGVALRLDA